MFRAALRGIVPGRCGDHKSVGVGVSRKQSSDDKLRAFDKLCSRDDTLRAVVSCSREDKLRAFDVLTRFQGLAN